MAIDQAILRIFVQPEAQTTSATKLATTGLLVVAMFAFGWIGGRYAPGWSVIKQATIDSYINRYRAMSEAGLDSIVYYVSTKDSTALYELAAQSNDIIEVVKTRITDLYDVRISYANRVPTVRALRSMKQISAVITVPLFCH